RVVAVERGGRWKRMVQAEGGGETSRDLRIHGGATGKPRRSRFSRRGAGGLADPWPVQKPHSPMKTQATVRAPGSIPGWRLRVPSVSAALRGVWREGYGGRDFRADLMAGLVVGVVALPLSMALAIASGVPPQHGLYTAIV